jgi:parvulin-like peptidyl-prolyl isomerase
LFELRHLKHYYETQQDADLAGKDKDQLQEYKKQALDQVINDAYVKQLADKDNVGVSNQEVDDAVRLLREQNRLGNNDQEFADVLKEFWGWSVDDFRRELRQQLLAQKVVATIDTATADKARQAFAALQNSGDFAAIAKQYSDDAATKDSGGEYPFSIDRNNRDIAPKLVNELYKLQPGQTSQITDTGYTLEIVKVLSQADGKVRAAHISKNYQPLANFLKRLQDKNPPKRYIKV